MPIFTRTGYPYFILNLALQGYIYDMPAALGWGYRDQLLCYHQDVVRSFYSLRDSDDFKKFIASKTEGEINDLLSTILERADRLESVSRMIADKCRENALVGEPGLILPWLEGWAQAVRGLYAVYRLPTLLDANARGKFSEAVWIKAQQIKDHCGRIFAAADKNAGRPLATLIAMPITLPPEDVFLLSAEELAASLRQGRSAITDAEIAARRDRFILGALDKQIIRYTGEAALVNEPVARIPITPSAQCELRGTGACPGTATGKIRVVVKAEDLAANQEPIIIVCPMTTVQFTPYLAHAQAIITDEGGVTCHAAVLAREFRIPCVIGTKIATQVFKDGDLVEVDANQGIVRKIQ